MKIASTARKPWTVERHDQEDGSISYEVWDTNPDSYRRVVCLNDSDNEEGRNAKRDAYAIAALSTQAIEHFEPDDVLTDIAAENEFATEEYFNSPDEDEPAA